MWFTASLLFKSQPQPTASADPLWEEQIVLLEARDAITAEQKAVQRGTAGEHEDRNQAGELVRWSFERVETVCEVEDSLLQDGTELFSRFLKDSEVKSILTPFEDEQ
jgi:hypothetical protein